MIPEDKRFGVSFVSKNSVSFRMWAPVADKVELLLFSDSGSLSNAAEKIPMKKEAKGVWRLDGVDCTEFSYYKYRIENFGDVNDVADIWSFCCSADSVASEIIDVERDGESFPAEWEKSYTNPFSGEYSSALIYEMHVWDWAFAVGGDGAFLDISESGLILDHLKKLGVTHIQILPSFDYAQTAADRNYNWGYNPYHYNAIEARYVRNMKDGHDAVKQFRQFVKVMHDNGIAVNMDVVYNHTSGTGEWSLYDRTVPGYFYRLNEDGSYSDGSGCGNETASNHVMFRHYMIESLRHFMNHFHINGFRFDLMGVHEIGTMNEIRKELGKIDPCVMVYGEPWCGGACLVKDGCCKENIDSGEGVACFNDDFRDAIKGAEFGGFQTGWVQDCMKDGFAERICRGLTGSLRKHGGFTENMNSSINYVECHDNYTLHDKLLLSMSDTKTETSYENFRSLKENLSAEQENFLRKQDRLCAALVLLAQGVPFLDGGQEFMRTKLGNPDSYSSDFKGGHQWSNEEILKCNVIDFSLLEKNRQVFDTYRALSAFRKQNHSDFGSNFSASAEVAAPGVVKYSSGPWEVWFNASSEDFILPSRDRRLVCLESGAPEITSGNTGLLPSMDFLIFRVCF